MKTILAGAIFAASLASVAPLPASAQSIGIGPDGPSVDLRSRGQRERDFERRQMRRDRDDDRPRYRTERYDDDRGRMGRRDRGY